MIATLKFNCEDSEQRQELERMMKSLALCGAIFEFQGYLREIEKGHISIPLEETIDTIKAKFYEILDDNGIRMDELYS
jgi:molybdopterin synthase catalytic subunit